MDQNDNGDVIFSTRTFVRSRRWWDASWVDWNKNLGDGPLLVVHRDFFEVKAPQGMIMESRKFVVPSATALMSIQVIGWAGTPFGRKRSIHIVWRNKRGYKVAVALTPVGELEDAWQALQFSGVKLA